MASTISISWRLQHSHFLVSLIAQHGAVPSLIQEPLQNEVKNPVSLKQCADRIKIEGPGRTPNNKTKFLKDTFGVVPADVTTLKKLKQFVKDWQRQQEKDHKEAQTAELDFLNAQEHLRESHIMQHNIEQRQATELQNMIETEAALHEETNALVRACLTSHNKEIRTMMNEQSIPIA